ncbi:MAG TPA: NepR family anti-sigma factor [Allosphingosinicella sp.]
MTFAREKDGDRRLKADPVADEDIVPEKPTRRKKRPDSPELGTALRSVYQRTVDEDIPSDLLDLLGKLG